VTVRPGGAGAERLTGLTGDPRGVQVVLFDWGGTLTPFHQVDLLDLWRVAARVLVPGELKGDEQRVEHVAAALAAAERDWWEQAVASGRSGTTSDVLAAAAHLTGIDVQTALASGALDAHLEAWTEHTGTDPEAAALLQALRERGIRTGLLSNTHWPRHWHERWLERDGVLGLLDARTYTSDLPHLKPHPEAFRAALADVAAACGEPPADPRHVVFVGDRPFDDIFGAARLGMRTVLRPHPAVPGYEVTPDASIASLAELLPLVDGWRRGALGALGALGAG